MFLIFLKMGQTAISYVYTPTMAVVILLQYHVLWPFTIRGKFFRLDQSETSNWKNGPIRDPHATRHKRSVLNSMLLSISKSRDNWEREGGAWCDLPNVTDIFQSGHLTYLYFRRNILVLCDCPRICLIFADMTRGPRGLVSGDQVISQEQTHQMSPAHPGHCKSCGI